MADRDKIVGQLIDNLNDVLVIIGDRDQELSDLIVSAAAVRVRARATTGRRSSARCTTSRSSRSDRGPRRRGAAAADPRHRPARRLAATLDDNQPEIDKALQILPLKLQKIGRTASYGSWFNFYLCNFRGQVTLPAVAGQPVDPIGVDYDTNTARCDLG